MTHHEDIKRERGRGIENAIDFEEERVRHPGGRYLVTGSTLS